VRVLTSDPSTHITRRLLSYLNHQDTTVSRRGTSYQRLRASPTPGCGTVNTAPYKGNGLYRASLDIISIEARHVTPTELSSSSGGDEVTLRSTPPAHPFGAENGGVNVTFTARVLDQKWSI
jgi:hypothetical protein